MPHIFWRRCGRRFGDNRTFSSGQCVLSLRKGSRFGRSNSAYRPICLSWYFRPLWWSRLNSSWRYCGEETTPICFIDASLWVSVVMRRTPWRSLGLSASSSTTLSICEHRRRRHQQDGVLQISDKKLRTLTDILSSLSRSMSAAFWQD